MIVLNFHTYSLVLKPVWPMNTMKAVSWLIVITSVCPQNIVVIWLLHCHLYLYNVFAFLWIRYIPVQVWGLSITQCLRFHEVITMHSLAAIWTQLWTTDSKWKLPTDTHGSTYHIPYISYIHSITIKIRSHKSYVNVCSMLQIDYS